VLSDIGGQAALTNPITGTGANGQVAFWNGTNTQTGDNGLFWDNVNKRLGIGTTAPLFPLSVVNGRVAFTGDVGAGNEKLLLSGDNVNITLDGSGLPGTPITQIRMRRGAGTSYTFQVGFGGFNSFRIVNDNNTGTIPFFISSANNVSIGTTTDAGFRLDVNGTFRQTGSTTASGAIARGSLISPTLVAAANNDVLVGLDIAPTFTNGAFTGVSSYGVRLSSGVHVLMQGNSYIFHNNNNSILLGTDGAATYLNYGFGTRPLHFGSLGSGNIIFRSSGNVILDNGNSKLLINTTTDAGFRLDVNGTARVSSSITAGSFIRSEGTSTQYLMADGSVSTLSNPITGTGTTNFLPKFTGGSTLGNSLIFDNGTNVGIGTTAPGEKLHVVGNIRIEQTTNSNSTITLNPNSGALSTGYQWNLVGANSSANYAFQIREGSTPYLHINNSISGSAGNVGIGTTTPTSMLTLNGTSPFIRIERSGVNTWQIQNNYLSTTNGFSINNISTSTTPFFIAEAGNVGIGTTSPSERLHVVGNGLFSGSLNAGIFNQDTPVYFSTNNTANSPALSIFKNTSSSTEDVFRVNSFIGAVVTVAKITATGAATFSSSVTAGGFVAIQNGNALILNNSVNSASGSIICPGGGSLALRSYGVDMIYLNENSDIRFLTSNTERMRLTSTGLGIGTTSPSERLTVSGNVLATAFFTSSDITLKNIIKTNYNPTGIEAISYKWKDSSIDTKVHIGYSAQQVQEFMPDAVSKDSNGKLSVNYVEVLVAKIASLEAEVKLLKAN
jgi:hypothetical protein